MMKTRLSHEECYMPGLMVGEEMKERGWDLNICDVFSIAGITEKQHLI